jgi:hypothetical protein
MDFLLSMKAGNFKMLCSSRRCWSFDQQPNLAVLPSIAKVALIQRFACWSKRPTWAYTSIENFIISRRCRSRRCWSFDQQPNLSVLLSIAEIILIQRFACWSNRPTWAFALIVVYFGRGQYCFYLPSSEK